MAISVSDFWELLGRSRLLEPQQLSLLRAQFARRAPEAPEKAAESLARWLIGQKLLTAYQAKVLLAGRSGPFQYGDYQVSERLPSQTAAAVFRAQHLPTQHTVLLLFASAADSRDDGRWSALHEHGQRHCLVCHPNLSRCFEIVDLGKHRFAVTEDVAGQSLQQHLQGGRKLKPVDACYALWLASLGLAALHEHGLIHGDICPDQLWLDRQGNVLLARNPLFAPAALDPSQIDRAAWLSARAGYVAPELTASSARLTQASDLFALGVTFYQLLTGRLPPPDRVAEGSQLPAAGLPAPLQSLLHKMTALDPAQRTLSAAQLARHLAQLLPAGRRKPPSPKPLPTLVAFENWLQQHGPAPVAATPPAVSSPPQGATPLAAPPPPPPPPPEPAAAPPDPPAEPAAELVPTIAVDSGEPAAANTLAARYRQRRSPRKKWLIGGGATVAAGLIVAALVVLLRPQTDTPTAARPAAKSPAVPGPAKTAQSEERTEQAQPQDAKPTSEVVLVADDGRTLWASPTSGPPVQANYVPPSVRVLMAVRPASLLAVPDGPLALRALGPRFLAARQAWQQAAGVPLEQIDQLLIGLHDNGGRMPRASFVVRLATPASLPALVARWGNPAGHPAGRGQIFNGGQWSYFVPLASQKAGESQVQMFVMGSAADMDEVAKKGDAPPVLRREINQLLQATDRDRHFTALVAPNFLFNEQGQQLLSGPLEKVRQPLQWFLGDGLQAAMISLHLSGQFYVELRFIARADIDHVQLAKALQGRLEQVPDMLESYIDRLDPPAYWRPLARRFPLQVRLLHRYTRVAAEDRQAVINAVLPPYAAPNLVAATELTIASAPGAAAAPPPGTGKPVPQNLQQLLAVQYDVEIPSEDMINVMRLIQEDISNEYKHLPFSFQIRILGTDLQLEGITQNQRVNDFRSQGKTLAEVLTGIVMKANPVTTVRDPSEPDQKLVWVVGPDPQSGKEAILITTRAAAAAKKYQLPAPFRPKSSS